MTAFVSHRPNTDPKPYCEAGFKNLRLASPSEARPNASYAVHDPRPEYTQTRDKKPWVIVDRIFGEERFRQADSVLVGRDAELFEARWDPRHDEFDPPVNGLLEAYRADALTAAEYLAQMDMDDMRDEATPTEIDRARRVLLKFAAVYS